MKVIKAVIVLVWLVGCASPGFTIKPVEDNPSLLVGLASPPAGTADAKTQHNHPVNWTTGDLHAILKRLALQEGSGLLDSSRPPQAVFSQEDLAYLIPALQQTFSLARPADWIVFAVWGASSPSHVLEVTSGGMFLQDQQLHILLANHRERVSSEEIGIHAIRKNPFHVLRDVNRRLLFYPTDYIVKSQNAWLAGGFDSPASELILDYQALLATKRPDNPIEPEETRASERSHTDRRVSPADDTELSTLQEEISSLKEEISRLKEQMKQQAADPSENKAP